MCRGNQTKLRHYLNTLTRTINCTSQLTRIKFIKSSCQKSESIYPPKLVKKFCRFIHSDSNADLLMTRNVF